MNNNTPRPFLVKLDLWGIKTRATAIAFIWICVGIAVVSAIRHFWIGLVLLLAAAWYWYAMRWMDRRGGWTTPGKTSTQIIATLAIITGLLAIAGKAFFIGYYRIPQNGMYPTLPAGSILFTLKRAYSDTSDVKRGDIVVFVREQNGKHYNYIWRVVGMPGETVEASGESLTITVSRSAGTRWRDRGQDNLARTDWRSCVSDCIRPIGARAATRRSGHCSTRTLLRDGRQSIQSCG